MLFRYILCRYVDAHHFVYTIFIATTDNHNYRSRGLPTNIILLFRKSEWNRNHNNIEKHVHPSIYLYIKKNALLKYLRYTYMRVGTYIVYYMYIYIG